MQPTPDGEASSLFAASIHWGDGTDDDAVVGGSGSFLPVSQGEHTYTLEGTYTQQVTLKTSDGTSLAAAQRTVLVADAPLTDEDASLLPVSATAGVALTAVPVAAFSDADPDAVAGDFSAVIDWGDGETSLGTVGQTESGAFVVEGDHVYTAGGMYWLAPILCTRRCESRINRYRCVLGLA